MNIDTKRLATDAAYWDEVAPEGATHFCGELFYRFGSLIPSVLMPNGRWVKSKAFECGEISWTNFIPRPTTPAAPEWDGEGLPPVGEEVEASFVSGSMDQYWSKGKVVAHDNGLPVVRVAGVYYGLNLDRLRPLRTKEQRQKDELSDLITDNIKVDYTDGNFYIDDDKAVNAIIAAGWRKDR